MSYALKTIVPSDYIATSHLEQGTTMLPFAVLVFYPWQMLLLGSPVINYVWHLLIDNIWHVAQNKI